MNRQDQESPAAQSQNALIGAAPARHLAIYVRDGGIDYAIRHAGQEPPRLGSVEVDTSLSGSAKVLEEAVYMTPSLLGDFSRTDIVADSPHFAVIPDVISDDETLQALASTMWPDMPFDRLVVNRAGKGASIISSIDTALTGFAGRTFCNPSFHHRLSVLTAFFRSLSSPVNRVKIHAHFASGNKLDIVAFTTDSLLMANTFDCMEDIDAVYYILASVKDCGFDPLDDELLLSGAAGRRDQVTDTLRKYLNSVMPLLLPRTDNAPLELKTIDL